MNQGHYVCDVLYYNTETEWNCDDDTITQYPGYPMNFYNDLSIDKKQKEKNMCIWIYQIGLCPYYIFKEAFLHRSINLLLQGSQYKKKLNILREELLILELSRRGRNEQQDM